MNRRIFISNMAAAGAGVALLGAARPAAYGRAPLTAIEGFVTAGGKPAAGVRVTDGLRVVRTNAEGRYRLEADPAQPFVYISVPAGCRIPVGPSGTARFYQPMPRAAGRTSVSFELEKSAADDTRHTMLVLADIQVANLEETARFHAETVPDLLQTIRGLPGERFAVSCGDIMFDNLSLFPEYERAAQRVGIPFFQVVGNHDLDQDAASDLLSTRTFESRYGPRYYSFDRGQVHYVVLDDVLWEGKGYTGYLDNQQLGWLARDLGTLEPGATVIVALHIPVGTTIDRRQGKPHEDASTALQNRYQLRELLAPFQAHIVSGHTHDNEHIFEGRVHEQVHGAVCGAWWSGDICYDGTPNGYGVYDIDGESVRWRYKATGAPADRQMRLYAGARAESDPAHLLTANVWDWDPAWRVLWYEGSDRRGEMQRRTAPDPLSVKLHAGPELPPRREWIDPQATAHMFWADMGQATGAVRVEATDRWGRVYTQALAAG